MKVVLFCHSLISDWNHGNAHFLRGVASELVRRGHRVVSYEPEDAWSVQNLEQELGALPLGELRERYPLLDPVRYGPSLDLDAALDGAALVLVHEWNEPWLVRSIGQHRRQHGGYRLLFHDTHHRTVSDPSSLARLDLSGFDGVLAFGEAVREQYTRAGWARRAFTWHEAADTEVFRPLPQEQRGDLVWVGNWGDEERSRELDEFLLGPVAELGLRARVHGVRYPEQGLRALSRAGVEFGGYWPNHRVPELFAQHRLTVHVPRRPYASALPGIPTIRVFEALACGIPLVSAPWQDSEGLFRPGDLVFAADGAAMTRAIHALLHDASFAQEVAARGLQTVRARHTCARRVDELMAIAAELGVPGLAAKQEATWD